MQKKIAICLPYAVTIRDFVHSGAILQLINSNKYQIIVYTLNPDVPELKEVGNKGVEIHSFHQSEASKIENILKKLYPMFFADQFVYLAESIADRFLLKTLASICCRIKKIVGVRNILLSFRTILLFLFKIRGEKNQLHDGISLLIGTRSLINSIDYDLMAEASKRKIPILTIASSWDNFTTKGFFPFCAIKTIVWNQKMKNELIELFKLPDEEIDIAGYPRANILCDNTDNISTENYLKSIGIKGYKKFILYSASYGELTRVSSYPVPLEYITIRKLLERLVNTLAEDICVLIRLHPFSKQEDSEYLSDLEGCFVFVPGRKDAYVERVMNINDERHLANQLAKSECIISLASTVSIDALTLNRPIINVNFDPVSGLKDKESTTRFYKWNHFRDLVSTANLPLANNYDEIVEFVDKCINKSYKTEVNLDSFENMYVPLISKKYPNNIVKSIDNVW